MKEYLHTNQELRMRQALPLESKVAMTKLRIREWVHEFGEDKVYVSFSGGKDSTVLLHIVREMYPNIPAVFSDTGLEYPEPPTGNRLSGSVRSVLRRFRDSGEDSHNV